MKKVEFIKDKHDDCNDQKNCNNENEGTSFTCKDLKNLMQYLDSFQEAFQKKSIVE